MPWVLSNLKGTRRADLGYHITSPYLLLVGSLLTVAFGLWIGELVITGLAGTLQFSYWWFSAYVVAFGPSMLFGTIYWQQEHSLSWLKAIIVFHVFAHTRPYGISQAGGPCSDAHWTYRLDQDRPN